MAEKAKNNVETNVSEKLEALGIGRPLALLAELSHRCPLQCPYCSNPLELEERSIEMGTQDWLRVLAKRRLSACIRCMFLAENRQCGKIWKS